MKRDKSRKRLLSDPFCEVSLPTLFENLSLVNNENTLNNMEQTLARLEAQMAVLVATNTDLTEKLNRLETAQAANQAQNTVTIASYEDIVPTYTNGDGIQLDAFKVIHEFNGDKKTYRSWRTQVTKLMKQIEGFKTHPKYAAALSIIRAKISGAASDILINNNTAHNIDAITDRLDFSYADQRPLYVIEAEMTTKRQGSKSLQEFYDAINQALNMVITKITMTYKEAAEQKSLITETQSKAIRTFVTGLNSQLIRTTLYSNMPQSLSQAFAIAQTIQYDNQHLQLEVKMPEQQKNIKKFVDTKPNFNPNFRYQSQQPNQAQRPNVAQTPQPGQQNKPTPMEVDSSGQYVKKTPFQPNDFQQMKRQREQSFQNANRQQQSFQHMSKQQRVNHVDEVDDIRSIHHDDSLEDGHENELSDQLSTTTERESVFLDE